jgi:hypothetical protein
LRPFHVPHPEPKEGYSWIGSVVEECPPKALRIVPAHGA